MKRTVNLLLLILTCCTSNNSNTSEKKEDSLSIIVESKKQASTDSIAYIGFIRKFLENDEYYTDLYFKAPYDYRNYEEVAGRADTVLFSGDETSRSRIPMEYASKFFDLSGIQTIEIFDSKGNQLTTGEFVRVELFDDMINSGFVAVYKVAKPQISNPSYCIGNRKWDLDPTQSYESLSSEKLNSAMSKFLKLDGKQLWGMNHFSLKSTSEIYSIVSADTTAFVVESRNGKMNVLYASGQSESINEVVFIPLRINGKPVLLTNCTVPETDSDWTNLLTYDGNTYKDSRRNRIIY